MRRMVLTALSMGFLALGATPAAAQDMMPQMAATEMVEFQATVVDMSCKLVYNLQGEEMHRECAQICADRGIPLGLLADDGTFYLPVSAAMPGEGANAMLRGHAEHHVTVKGRLLSRAGMNSIVIDEISM